MTGSKPNFKELWQAAEQATSTDTDPLYALADALRERSPDIAYALWWMVGNNRMPERYEEGVPWTWEFSWEWQDSPARYLPYFLKGLMANGYRSFPQTVSTLGKALKAVRDETSLKRQVGSYDEATRLQTWETGMPFCKITLPRGPFS